MAPSQQALPSTLRSPASSGLGAGEGRGSAVGLIEAVHAPGGALQGERREASYYLSVHGFPERLLPPELEIESSITVIHRCRTGRKGPSGATGRREASPPPQQARGRACMG